MKWNIGSTPPGFRTPSTSKINPPVETRTRQLPFRELSWKNFENLCLDLISEEYEVEHCQVYGTPGQSQEGIDIYAKKHYEGKFTVYQCKRVKKFGPSKIKDAVSKFLQGDWVDKSNKFVLCASEGFDSTVLADEVEVQRLILEKKGIKFDTWDKYKLSSKLKQCPKIVDDFFGREWVKVFCGIEAANKLGERLDINEVIELRNELRNFYQRMFKLHDRFPFISNINSISLKNRYVFPDVDDVRIAEQISENLTPRKYENTVRTDLTINDKDMEIRKHYSPLEYQQRHGFENWLYMSDHSIVLGGPGSGKSTLLRFIAIDLLSDYPQLNLLESKWGQFIPLWIPFSSWTKKISDDSNKSSLKEFVNSWLVNWGMEKIQPLIEKALDNKKVLLLVDGLDEWINEQAAKSALNRLITFIDSYNIPIIVSSRPHGFERLGIHEIDWQIGSLSDFSVQQQEQLSEIWFKYLLKNEMEELTEEKLNLKVKFETERLLNELHDSIELKELAKIPLLLCLLIYHKYKGYNLPQSRFKVYDSLITHLINEHPQMRKLAGDIILNPSELDVNEIRLIMEYLAYYVQKNHSNGIIGHSEALSALKDFLENDSSFKFIPYKANKCSKKVLKMNEDDFGLIVQQSPDEIGFLHRVFQEYLAGNYISHKNQNEQKLILKSYSADSQWREVLLSFFNAISGSGNIENLVGHLRSISKEANKFNQYSIELLLYEIAFGNFNCPNQLSIDLALESFKKVELGSWMPQRERILRLILNGLISESLREVVQLKLKKWFPGRYSWRSHIYYGMNNWPKTPEVIDCLWKGIHDEEIDNRNAAANTLAVIAKGDQEIGNNVAFLAKTAVDAGVRATMIYSLIKGWDSHEDLITILKNACDSKCFEIRLMGILGKVYKKIHTKKDLDELIKLISGRRFIKSVLKEHIIKCFLKGWPKSKRVKKICLKSLRDDVNWEKQLDHDISLHVLTEGYPQDEEVAQFFIEQFKTGDNSFIITRLTRENIFTLLSKNFKNHPLLVEVIDKWVEDPKRKEIDIPEISSLASIGCTDKIKGILLTALDNNNHNSRWAANSLIKNWGMEDTEVSNKLTNFVFSSNKIASIIGEFIPKIIEDKVKCRKRLLELLRDTNHSNHHFVLFGLKDLKYTEDDKEVVDIVLDMLPKINGILVINTLIKNYPLNQQVKELAMQELSKRMNEFDNTGIVAKNYKDDAIIREKIIDMICPLPSHLREVIVKYLGDMGSIDEFTISLLSLYDYEHEDIVKTQASINYFKLLKLTNRDITYDLDYLDHTIDVCGMDYDKRRRAAFCGLVLMRQLNEYKHKISFSKMGGYINNIPLFKLILENLEYINESLGEEFWDDSSESTFKFLYTKDEFYLLADQFPILKAEAIDFLENGNISNDFLFNILNFLSRNYPKSQILLQYCLKALKNESNSYGSLRDTITASKILGNHFSSDNKILEDMISNLHIEYSNEKLILVLCEVYPESEKLTAIFNEFKEKKINPGLFASLQLVCQKGKTEWVFNGLSYLLSDYSIEDMPSWIIQEFKRPIISRIQKDNKFLDMLIKSLDNNSCSSFKATIPRLISASGKMTPEFRKWCIGELNNQLSPRNSPEIGMDLIAGELRPVAHSLLDIL